MIPKDLPVPLKPGDAQKENFYHFHNIVNHPTCKCSIVIETNQKLLDDREIKC